MSAQTSLETCHKQDHQNNWCQQLWNRTGKWFGRCLTRSSDGRLIQKAQDLIEGLDYLEQWPVNFASRAQLRQYDQWILRGQAHVERMKNCDRVEAAESRVNLSYRISALKYRSERQSVKNQAIKTHYCLLKDFATQWKHHDPFFQHAEGLTERDLRVLNRICCYPTISQLLVENLFLRQEFFTSALKAELDPDIFAQFPATHKAFHANQIDMRLGFGKHVKITGKDRWEREREGNNCRKDLVVRCKAAHGKIQWVSFLNPDTKVRLPGLTLTVAEVYERFRNEEYEWTGIDFFANGLYNFHSEKWGPYDEETGSYVGIDPSEKDWHKKIPYHRLSLRAAERRYAPIDLKGGTVPVASIRATKGGRELTLLKNHASIQLSIPYKEKGKRIYRVYVISLFSDEFPKTTMEKICFAVKAHPGRIGLDTVVYQDRRHGGISFPITHPRPMEIIGDYIVRGRDKDELIYQFFVKNCADFTREVAVRLNPDIPKDLYIAPLDKIKDKIKLPFVIDGFVASVLACPVFIQNIVFTPALYLLGGSSSRLYAHENGREERISLLAGHLKPWVKAPSIPASPACIFSHSFHPLTSRF